MRSCIRLRPYSCFLPFEHAEDLSAQERAVTLFDTLLPRAPQGCETLFEGYADYARRHRDVIARWGRFPHRNSVLGRTPRRMRLTTSMRRRALRPKTR